MNTAINPKFSISAEYIGPIMSLDCELTKNAQNLIFARNGTGKSFLSRAFRYLDFNGQHKELTDAARNLVSDESPDGKGHFGFSRGATILGTLELSKAGSHAKAEAHQTIFHVFSDEFIQKELREREYRLNGEFEKQIVVNSSNIQLDDAMKALDESVKKETEKAFQLELEFEQAKESELSGKAGVSKNLGSYKSLNFATLLTKFTEKPSAPSPSFGSIVKDLDSLKAIPSDPQYPSATNLSREFDQFVDLKALELLLGRITSPSTVSEEIKKKIDAHHDFYRDGIKIIDHENLDTCPLCEQSLSASKAKSVIDEYMRYFSDAEETHKVELRKFSASLRDLESELADVEGKLRRQKSFYDDLKTHIPSKREAGLESFETVIQSIRNAVSGFKDVLEQKKKALSSSFSLPTHSLTTDFANLVSIIGGNNAKVEDLNRAIRKSDDERKNLQRTACEAFEQEFANRRWLEIENLLALQKDASVKKEEVSALQQSGPTADVRSRIADTFKLLLREFFGDRYDFDSDSFTLRRGSREMERGVHRTLSDGEKTAIAFCYFIASIHAKVDSISDYKKLFLVFDDPVNSMSYDYVFAIAQTLKHLGISVEGDICLNPALITANKYSRPNLLVLTHSSYFFNVCLANRVVKAESAFSLQVCKDHHCLKPLKKYVAPFDEQLKDVYEVAHGIREPNHSTGNAIRSVLEAIGRFCRPDKTEELSGFVSHLAGEDGISIRSVLINSLSHGSYYTETASPDDLVMACTETIEVVKKYAAGHIEMLSAKADGKS